MYTWINTLKTDKKVLKHYWLTKVLSVYQAFSHLLLGICFSQKQHKIICLYVKTTTVTSYIKKFSETLNNYVATSNILDCNISYIYIVSKLIACYSLSDCKRLNIFDFAKDTKFRKAELQQVKIYKIPNKNKTRYKTNAAYTEKSILMLFIFIVETLLTGKTSISNDVIKWIPSFN